MVHRIRMRQPRQGRANTLRRRFADRVPTFFPRRGSRVAGAFEPEGGRDRTVQTTRIHGGSRRSDARIAFRADPEHKAVVAESRSSSAAKRR